MAVLRVEFNLQDLFILASLLVGGAEDYSPELLNECDMCVLREMRLFNKVTLTVLVRDFNSLLIVLSLLVGLTFCKGGFILFARFDTFVKCYFQNHIFFFSAYHQQSKF